MITFACSVPVDPKPSSPDPRKESGSVEPRGSPTSFPSLSRMEFILFGVCGVIVLAIVICVGVACARMRRKKKSLALSDAKYVAAAEHIDFGPERFSPRTASVSSTGSAATIMRQRSIRNRLESRLTQVIVIVFFISRVGF